MPGLASASMLFLIFVCLTIGLWRRFSKVYFWIDKGDAHLFTVAEFDPNGFILTANENFLAVVGYDLDEIKGQHHRMFVGPAEAASKEYVAFWPLRNIWQPPHAQSVQKERGDLTCGVQWIGCQFKRVAVTIALFRRAGQATMTSTTRCPVIYAAAGPICASVPLFTVRPPRCARLER